MASQGVGTRNKAQVPSQMSSPVGTPKGIYQHWRGKLRILFQPLGTAGKLLLGEVVERTRLLLETWLDPGNRRLLTPHLILGMCPLLVFLAPRSRPKNVAWRW